MTRRHLLASGAGLTLPLLGQPRAPVVNAAEHAWVLHDQRFRPNAALAVCPGEMPKHEYSAEFLLSQMQLWNVDHCVISHVCYYGRDNSYTSYCVKTWPGKFAGIGLLVGHRLYEPNDSENPSRLERLMTHEGLVGLRLSPIYDKDVVWLNAPFCYPLWKKAERLGAVFNVFLAPHQIRQVADMARRFPGVNIVIDHLAMIDISAADDAGFGPLLQLAALPNVYIRVSMRNLSKTRRLPYRDVWPFLERIYDRFGPKRMLWTNFFTLTIVRELIPFFTTADKEWILGRTAHRLYRFRA